MGSGFPHLAWVPFEQIFEWNGVTTDGRRMIPVVYAKARPQTACEYDGLLRRFKSRRRQLNFP
jgi:hypothetical protein